MHHVRALALLGALALAPEAAAVEQTVANDSVSNFSTATIVTGFAPGEEAASWLTSPCNGTVRAVQVFWRSGAGTAGFAIESAINIHRAGTFPIPGAIAQSIGGPVLNDGVMNEWRFIDENNVIPVNVPVASGEVFVVSLVFAQAPPAPGGPSVTRDNDGIQPGRNALRANVGGNFVWFNSATLGLTGDWVIRGVVDCPIGGPSADVVVAMSSTPASYTAGAALSYTLSVGNTGPSAATATSIVDTLPAALTGATWTCSPTGGATCAASGNGSISQSVNLPAGGAVTFAISGTVAPGTSGTITNSATATVALGITDPLTANNTATVNTTQLVQADVIAALSSTSPQYTPGAALDYTLTVSNAGPMAAPGTTVVDTFPAAYTGAGWSCSGSGGATCPASGSGNIAHSVDLPAGGSVQYAITGIVAAGTTGTLVNSATAATAAGITDPVPGNNSATLNLGESPRADVAVAMSATPAQYTAGAAFAYTLSVGNIGPMPAPGTLIADAFPAAYTGVTWSCSASGGASCAANGSGDILQSVNLPVGGTVVFAISGTVAPGTSGTLVNSATATVAAGIVDPLPPNNTAVVNTAQLLSADVAVAMTAASTLYTPGAPFDYTLSVSNAGPVAAPGTLVVDAFPAALSAVTWSCVGSGGATCSALGSSNISQLVNLPVGGTVEFEITGTVAPGTTGTLSNTATATVAAGIVDPLPGNNSATVNSASVPQADVSVTLASTPLLYTAGAALDYTLTVSNAGPAAAAGTTVVGAFPAAFTGVSWSCSSTGGGTCAASGSGNISEVVNLPAGGAVVFAISGTVAPGTVGTLANSASAVVAAGIGDPQAANNSVTLTTSPVPQADVAVGLSAEPASYTAGAALDYTLVVNNAGPDAALSTTVVDIFPAALGGISWTCSPSGGATCPASGIGNLSLQVNLPAGGEVVFDVSGTVAAGTTADLTNSVTAVVSASIVDPVAANNSASLDTPAGSLVPAIFKDGFEQ